MNESARSGPVIPPHYNHIPFYVQDESLNQIEEEEDRSMQNENCTMQNIDNKAKKPRLFIHIGAPKTGTSALQMCMVNYRQLLMSNKVCYSDYLYESDRHLNLYVSIAQEYFEKNGISVDLRSRGFSYCIEPPAEIIRRIKNTFVENNCDTLVISSEDLFLSMWTLLAPEYPGRENIDYYDYCMMSYLKEAFKEFDIKIVCYLRRQDDFMESLYNQYCKVTFNKEYYEKFFNYIIKTDKCKYVVDLGSTAFPLFEKFINAQSYMIEYYTILSEWSDVYGKENIIVRPYERSLLQNGIEHDFFKNILGLGDDFLADIALYKETNVSAKKDIMEYKMAMELFELWNEFNALNHVPELDYLSKNNKKNIMTAKQAERLLDYCKSDNERIAREYLKREDGILFDDKKREESDDYHGLSVKATLDISRELALVLKGKKLLLGSSIYMNCGNGYDNNDRIAQSVYVGESGAYYVKFTLPKPKDIIGLRFDPDEGRFLEMSIDSVLIDGKAQNASAFNASLKNYEYDVFFTTDPIYIISALPRFKEVEITGRVRSLSAESINMITNENAGLKDMNVGLSHENINLTDANTSLNNKTIDLDREITVLSHENTVLSHENTVLADDLNTIKRSRLLRFFSKLSKSRSLFTR